MPRGVVLLVVSLSTAALAHAADWPQWMGTNRDGVWPEIGILERFPRGGPTKVWSVPVHGGYSGPAVASGKVFLHEYKRHSGNANPSVAMRNELKGEERICCFDARTGKRLWENSYDCPYKLSYPAGPRCTPTVTEKLVFTLGAMGHLTCCDVQSGEVLWQKDLVQDCRSHVPMWGFCSHPIVHQNLVIMLVGSPEGLVFAFDSRTGNKVWSAGNTPVDPEGPGYGAPIIIEVNGKKQLVVWSSREVMGIEPTTGSKLWAHECTPTHGMAIMAPQLYGRYLFVAGMGACMTMEFDSGADTPKILWQGTKTTGLYPSNMTPIICDGTVYGADNLGHLKAVDLLSGKRLWSRTIPTTSAATIPQHHATEFLVRNGDRYFIFRETGHLVIAKLTSEQYEELDSAELIQPTGSAFGRKVVWAHPAFAERCIFVRNDEELACYSLAK